MQIPLDTFLHQLFSGELRDPEALSRELSGLAMKSMPEAHAVRLVRQQYQKNLRELARVEDSGWLDRSERGDVVKFERRNWENAATGQ